MRTVRAVLTVKRAVYLLLSLGLGTTWFVILVVGLSTGIGLLITLLGIPILIGVLYATRPMADLERALVHGLLDERADGPLPPPGQGRHLVVDHGARRRPADLEGHGRTSRASSRWGSSGSRSRRSRSSCRSGS